MDGWMCFTIDIGSMVIDSVQTGSISGVPNPNCIIPGTFKRRQSRVHRQDQAVQAPERASLPEMRR